jgi:hypothetical protein
MQARSPRVQQQLADVLDVLFNVAEASVAASMATLASPADQQTAAATTRDRLLGAAASVIQVIW